jgi:hypothetical protein
VGPTHPSIGAKLVANQLLVTRLRPEDLPRFVRATMCPDMPLPETLTAAGIKYVHTLEFAEILQALVESDPRFATGPDRATAYAWGVHLASDGIGHSTYVPADERHSLVETEVDTVVYYDRIAYPLSAGLASWEATAVQSSDCSPELVAAAAEVYIQAHGGSAISPALVMEATEGIAEWLDKEYAQIRQEQDANSSETYLQAQHLWPFAAPYEQSIRASACWLIRDTAPAVTAMLMAIVVSPSQITLGWLDPLCDEIELHIERKTGADGKFSQIAQTAATDVSYPDTDLTAGTTYLYRVEACNTVGCSGYSGESAATTLAPVDAAAVPVSSSGSGGGGCFIATATYGSPLAPQVQLLREFRDRYLISSAVGRTVVGWYYALSPSWAATIARSAVLRSIARVSLLPVLGGAALLLWSPWLGVSFLLLGVAVGLWLGFRPSCGAKDL